MALQPGPDTIVIVANPGTQQLVSLDALRNAPVRPGVEGDHIVALDAAGNPFRAPWTSAPVTPSVPDNAFVTEAGVYIVDEFGAFITL